MNLTFGALKVLKRTMTESDAEKILGKPLEPYQRAILAALSKKTPLKDSIPLPIESGRKIRGHRANIFIIDEI